MNLDKKTLEGIIGADTSTAEEQESDELGLNNTTVPTPEEEKNAGIEQPSEASVEEQQAEEQPGLDMGDTTEPAPEPDANPEPESDPIPGEPDETVVEPDGVSEATATKTFTQSQVDEIAGKVRKETREKTIRDIYSRYGVNTADELDSLMADAQRFATSKDDFAEKEAAWKQADEARSQELTSVKERVALLESGIDNNRFEDARLILKGKGLEVTAENIAAELETHPEWKKQQEVVPSLAEQNGLPFKKNPEQAAVPSQPEGPVTKISIPTLGNNSADNPQPELSERERALKMFKV